MLGCKYLSHDCLDPSLKVVKIQTLFTELAETNVRTALKQKDRHKENLTEEVHVFKLCITQPLGKKFFVLKK